MACTPTLAGPWVCKAIFCQMLQIWSQDLWQSELEQHTSVVDYVARSSSMNVWDWQEIKQHFLLSGWFNIFVYNYFLLSHQQQLKDDTQVVNVLKSTQHKYHSVNDGFCQQNTVFSATVPKKLWSERKHSDILT